MKEEVSMVERDKMVKKINKKINKCVAFFVIDFEEYKLYLA